jgi:hypothetical protein
MSKVSKDRMVVTMSTLDLLAQEVRRNETVSEIYSDRFINETIAMLRTIQNRIDMLVADEILPDYL